MMAGANIYDPYSGYGPYGRHNREYNKHELHMLLQYAGFEIESMFTADVHENRSSDFFDLSPIVNSLAFRRHDLGQYIFIKARKVRVPGKLKPSFLYRSYPENEMAHI
jgi:homogentisate 1,2-dioxygenase